MQDNEEADIVRIKTAISRREAFKAAAFGGLAAAATPTLAVVDDVVRSIKTTKRSRHPFLSVVKRQLA